MQRTRPSRRGARDDARGKLGWWSNERRREGGLVLDCGRTGIPAGVLPAIAPGSERPTRPILSESDKTKNKLNMFRCRARSNQCVPPVEITGFGVDEHMSYRPCLSSTYFRGDRQQRQSDLS